MTDDRDGDGRVSAEECVDGFTLLLKDRERFERTIVEPSASFFDLIDSDHDGRITADDYVAFLVALGIDLEVARTAFPEIDSDGDGFMDRDEYATRMEEFFTSDDPNGIRTASTSRCRHAGQLRASPDANRGSWQSGDRRIVCVLSAAEKLTGAARRTGS